jgi:hypothetical protein
MAGRWPQAGWQAGRLAGWPLAGWQAGRLLFSLLVASRTKLIWTYVG